MFQNLSKLYQQVCYHRHQFLKRRESTRMASSKMMSDIRQRMEQASDDRERSKVVVESILMVCHAYSTLAEDNQRLTSDLALILRQLRNQDIAIQQLQEQGSQQDATIASLEERVNHLKNDDGVLLIEILNYHREKAAAMTGTPLIYSNDFYTSRHGYRMWAYIYLNGEDVGKGTHLSVFFAIKKGRYDNYLSWPFQRQVTFTLLNQVGRDHLSSTLRPDPGSSSFQKPVEEINIPSGFPMFVAHRVIEDTEEGFLRDGKIAIKVTVHKAD